MPGLISDFFECMNTKIRLKESRIRACLASFKPLSLLCRACMLDTLGPLGKFHSSGHSESLCRKELFPGICCSFTNQTAMF